MKNELLNQVTAASNTTKRSGRLSPFLQLTEACARRRTIRIRVSLPRREACLTRRSLVAALREAELTDWDSAEANFLHIPGMRSATAL